MDEVSLLSREQINGIDKLNMFKKIGYRAKITDFSTLLGGFCDILRREGSYWIKPNRKYNVINDLGGEYNDNIVHRKNGIRPVMSYSKIKIYISSEKINEDGVKEVEYGEYPQYAVKEELQYKLEELYKNNELYETNKMYTTDSRKYYEHDKAFFPREYIEYELDDKKYVRVKTNSCWSGVGTILSNGVMCTEYNYVWIEVLPIKWLVDEEKDIALSKDILVAGIQFDNKEFYKGDFKNTNMYKYLNTYFIKDIQSKDSEINLNKATGTYEEAMKLIEEAKRKTRDILDKSIIGKSLIKHL